MDITIPSANPTLLRHFQYTDLQGNSNKFWEARAWQVNGQWAMQSRYGRVGDENFWPARDKARPMSLGAIESKIREKTRAGRGTGTYKEVKIGSKTISFGDDAIGRLIKYILSEANEYISTYLAGATNDLSPEQIQLARAQLRYINHVNSVGGDVVGAVQDFFTLIPTRLPRRIDPWEVTAEFVRTMDEQEDRLKQLEAAVQVQAGNPSDAVGVNLEVAPGDEAAKVEEYFETSRAHGKFSDNRLLNVYKVSEPREFSDVGNVQDLFHGTGNQNVLHILRSGLLVPTVRAGVRAFGQGLYFADRSTKSMQYCSGNSRRLMFIAEVSLGNKYRTDKGYNHWVTPPNGYDSVFAEAGYTYHPSFKSMQFNEYIIYASRQQRLKYILEWQ